MFLFYCIKKRNPHCGLGTIYIVNLGQYKRLMLVLSRINGNKGTTINPNDPDQSRSFVTYSHQFHQLNQNLRITDTIKDVQHRHKATKSHIDNNRHRCYTALKFSPPANQGKHRVKRILCI